MNCVRYAGRAFIKVFRLLPKPRLGSWGAIGRNTGDRPELLNPRLGSWGAIGRKMGDDRPPLLNPRLGSRGAIGRGCEKAGRAAKPGRVETPGRAEKPGRAETPGRTENPAWAPDPRLPKDPPWAKPRCASAGQGRAARISATAARDFMELLYARFVFSAACPTGDCQPGSHSAATFTTQFASGSGRHQNACPDS